MDGYQISFQFQIGLVRDRLVVDSASLNLKARPCFNQTIFTIKFTFKITATFYGYKFLPIKLSTIFYGLIKVVSSKLFGKLIVAPNFCLWNFLLQLS